MTPRLRASLAGLLLVSGLPAFAQVPAPREEGLGIYDRQGGFYSVTNRFYSNAYFQITKLGQSGAMLWNVPYNPGLDSSASALTVDKEGNLIIAGTIKDQNHRDLLLVKFTPYGNFFWKQSYEAGGNAVPTVVGADDVGNIYVGATVSEPGGSHLVVTRYGPAGAMYWAQIYRGGRTNYARAMLIDRSGHATLTVETTTGDGNSGYYQTHQVLFTSYGAVVVQQ